jgi:ABC-2 type transport system ATP-binding protein
MLAIEAERITKVYRDSTSIALKEISLKVESGKICTLVGRNGAGKTTFVKICATQLLPTSGSLRIFGYDILSEANKIRKMISIVPQEGRPLRSLTAWDHIFYWLRIRGIDKNEAKTRTYEILHNLELYDYRNTLAMNLSGGMKQKILVGMAMCTDAQLLFLDEPTIGLDPVSRRQVWKIINLRKEEGRTIFLTTHYMDEAEILSDYIIIINNGTILQQGTILSLRKIIPENIRVDIAKGGIDMETLKSFGSVLDTGGKTLRVFTYASNLRELSAIAIDKNLFFTTSPITFDDVFIQIVRKKSNLLQD